MTFVTKEKFYSYFAKKEITTTTSYENLLEGWNAYKKGKETDFDYGDAWQETTYYIIHDYAVENKPQRPHARSLREWERVCEKRREQEYKDAHCGLSEIEVEFLTSLFADISNTDDEEVII